MSAEGFGVDGGEVDCTLVFDCQGLEGFSELGALLRRLGEDIGERDIGLVKNVSMCSVQSSRILLTAMYPAYVSGPTSPTSGVLAVFANVVIASESNLSSNLVSLSSKSLNRTMAGCLTPAALASAASLVAPNR
jgi:hypothetical protein